MMCEWGSFVGLRDSLRVLALGQNQAFIHENSRMNP